MQVSYKEYSFKNALERISSILDTPDDNYIREKKIPDASKINSKNGFYVDICILHVDIRESKKLYKNNCSSSLAKLYKVYISEVISVLRGNKYIQELKVEGDGIWAIFDISNPTNISNILDSASKISSLITVINYYLNKRDMKSLKVGIGIDIGESLLLKSNIDDFIWIGKVFDDVFKLSAYGNSNSFDKEIMISKRFYDLLHDDYQKDFSWNETRSCYHGEVFDNLISSSFDELN